MPAFRIATAGLLAGLSAASLAHAQLVLRGGDPWPATGVPLAIQPASAQVPIGCGASLLPCATPESAFQARRPGAGLRWALEMSQMRLGPLAGPAAGTERQGLNLSLVGRQPLFGSAFSVYGKLGTTYGYADPGAVQMPVPAGLEGGYGLSFGAGVSMEVTRRLSATLGWESHELRLGSGGRDNVRATSLGLQYRY